MTRLGERQQGQLRLGRQQPGRQRWGGLVTLLMGVGLLVATGCEQIDSQSSGPPANQGTHSRCAWVLNYRGHQYVRAVSRLGNGVHQVRQRIRVGNGVVSRCNGTRVNVRRQVAVSSIPGVPESIAVVTSDGRVAVTIGGPISPSIRAKLKDP